jgi:hypothetical protein
LEVLATAPFETITGTRSCLQSIQAIQGQLNDCFDNGLDEMNAIREQQRLFKKYIDAFACRLQSHLEQCIQIEVCYGITLIISVGRPWKRIHNHPQI